MLESLLASRAFDATIMLDLRKKNQSDFGFVSVLDDRDIEVTHLARESRQGLWSEGFKLIRDIFLIIVVFILFGVFFVQPVVVEGKKLDKRAAFLAMIGKKAK